MTETWWVNAFVGPGAEGNATCVVLEDLEERGGGFDRAAVARALRAPDTAFVCATHDPTRFEVRFFSPFEGEMSFCGQGLIAVDAVLRRRQSGLGALRLVTQTGDVVARAEAGTEPCSWFEVPRERIQSSAAPFRTSAGLPRSEFEPVVVDSGRRRWFSRLSAAELETLTLPPESVLALCGEHRLSGLCFYAPLAGSRLRLRVFTVSLAGKEDASTGGAVAALGALLPRGSWAIEQGHGHPLARGALLLDNASSDVDVAVGGRVKFVASGQLST